jgi:hypothetical protein
VVRYDLLASLAEDAAMEKAREGSATLLRSTCSAAVTYLVCKPFRANGARSFPLDMTLRFVRRALHLDPAGAAREEQALRDGKPSAQLVRVDEWIGTLGTIRSQMSAKFAQAGRVSENVYVHDSQR